MKMIQSLSLLDPRHIRFILAFISLILFVIGAAAPGSPGDVGIR